MNESGCNADVNRVVHLLRQEFRIDERHTEDKFAGLGPNEFGYRSVHGVIGLDEPWASMQEWKRFANLWAEVQVKSLLQHAWATISHKLYYKGRVQMSEELQRQLFQVSALLELADDVFSALQSE